MKFPFLDFLRRPRIQLAVTPGRPGAAATDANPLGFKTYTAEVALQKVKELECSTPAIQSYRELLESYVVGSGFLLETEDVRLRAIWQTWLAGLTEDWPDIQRTLIWCLARDGELFIQLTDDLIQYDPQCFPRQAGGYTDGCKTDNRGRVTHYRYNPALGGRPGQPPLARDIPAGEIIHFYRRDRVGQLRGDTWFQAVLSRLEMLDRFESTAISVAEISAAITAYIETDKEGVWDELTGNVNRNVLNPNDPDYDEAKAEDLKEQMALTRPVKPGELRRLFPGDKVVKGETAWPAAAWDAIKFGLLLDIAQGLGLSYAGLTGDSSRGSFSSIRFGYQRDIRFYMHCQDLMAQLLSRILHRVYAAATGDDAGISMLQYKWRRPGFDYIEPMRDIAADQIALAAGLASRTELMAKRGKDFNTMVDERAAEEAYAQSKGVILPQLSLPDYDTREHINDDAQRD